MQVLPRVTLGGGQVLRTLLVGMVGTYPVTSNFLMARALLGPFFFTWDLLVCQVLYFWYYITYIRGVIAIVPNPSLGYCASRSSLPPPSSSRRSRVSRQAGRGEDGCELEGRATCRVSLSHCCASRRPRSTPTKHGHQPLASTRTTTHQLLPDSLPDSNRGEGADAARLAILSSYPPNGVLPGCGGPVGRAGCDPLARSEQRQDSGNCRGGGLVIPSSLLRPSAVCYVTVITALCP